MPRNKTTKQSAKRQNKDNLFANIQKMEKDFLATPSTFAKHIAKAVAELKQKENKVKSAISKIKAQLKNAESRIKDAEKSKHTATGKKQLKIAKKIHAEISKTYKSMEKELNEIIKAADATASKQAKFSALRKHLSQFEKDWAKSAKKIKATAKATKKKVKVKAKKAKTSQSTSHTIIEDRPHTESFDQANASSMEEDTSQISS